MADGPHRSLGLFKSHTKLHFPTEQLTPHRTPLKVAALPEPWRKSSGSGVCCSLRRGAPGWPQEIQKGNYWSALRILDSSGLQRTATVGRNCSRECRYGSQPEFSMVLKTYPCCKETSDSVVYSALAVQNHKQHKQMSFQHRIELDAVSLGKINPTWGSQSSHRLQSPLASGTNSILHIYYY